MISGEYELATAKSRIRFSKEKGKEYAWRGLVLPCPNIQVRKKRGEGGVDGEKVECSIVSGRLWVSGKKKGGPVTQGLASTRFKLPVVTLQAENSCSPPC